MSEERLITALNDLAEKIDDMSEKLGRGTRNKTSQVPNSNSKTAKTPEEKALAAKMDNLSKMAAEGVQIQKKSNKANEEQTDSVKDLTKAQQEAEKEQKKLEASMKRAKDGFFDFGKSLLSDKVNISSAFGQLGGTLSRSSGMLGKSISGAAMGIGYTIGAMQNFAESAKDMGAFADLGAFQVGSVRQAKVLSGLGDSFIKVIEQSNGTFKALGGTSQDAVDNLSNLSRGLKYGSSYLNSAMKKSLGTDLVKSVDKAARATAAMGLTNEDQANLSGSILASTMLNAKNEDDAKQKFVKAMAESVTSARGLSDAFGMSAKTVLAAMAEFRKTQAGTVAGIEGNEGAKNLYAVLKKFPSLSSDPAKLANIAMAMSEGNLAKAQYNVEGGESNQLLQQLFQATQGTKGGLDIEQFNKNIERQRGEIDLMYESRKSMQGFNDKFAQSAVEAKAFLRERDIATGKIAPDKKAIEEKTGKSEADNIQTMNSLTAALESLRGVMIGLTAGILALLGPVVAIALSGGIGAKLATAGLKETLLSIAKLPFTIAMATKEFYLASGGFKGMWESAKGFGSALMASTKSVWDSVGGFKGMWESAKGFGATVWSATKNMAMAAQSFVASMWMSAKNMYASMGGGGGILQSIKTFGLTVLQAGASAAKSLWAMAVTAIQTVVPALVAMARSAWASMLGGFRGLGKVLGPVAGWFSKLGPMLGTVARIFGTWGTKLLPWIGRAFSLLSGPIGWLIAGATLLYTFWDEIVDVSKALWNGFTGLVGWLADGAGAIWDTITAPFVALTNWLADGAGAIWDTITAPFVALSNWLGDSWLAKTLGFGSNTKAEPATQASLTAKSTAETIQKISQTTAPGQIVKTTESADFASITTPSTVTKDFGKTTANTDATNVLGEGNSVLQKASEVLTPESIAQLMGYLSSMQSDLSAIRSNTKMDSLSPPVRLA
jgi:hypothetical protein